MPDRNRRPTISWQARRTRMPTMTAVAQALPTPAAPAPRAAFVWDDPFLLDDQLGGRGADDPRHGARLCAGEAAAPRASRPISTRRPTATSSREMGELGLLGVTLPEEYGGAGAELRLLRPRRARGRARRFRLSLDDERAVLARHVSDPRLRRRGAAPAATCRSWPRGEWIGCFGLTEPDAGSDPGGMTTRAEKIDGGYRLTGVEDCGSPTRPSPTSSSSGPSRPRMTARSAASFSRRA